MLFIEFAVFTEDVVRLLTDEQYWALQEFLADRPRSGVVIQGTGGLRKLRWAAGGGGKRGGVRVVYHYAAEQSQIRMILIYRKGMKDDLSMKEKADLKRITAEW